MRLAHLRNHRGCPAAACIYSDQIQCISCPGKPEQECGRVVASDVLETGRQYQLVLKSVQVHLMQAGAVGICNPGRIFHHLAVSRHRKFVFFGFRTGSIHAVGNGEGTHFPVVLPYCEIGMSLSDPASGGAVLRLRTCSGAVASDGEGVEQFPVPAEQPFPFSVSHTQVVPGGGHIVQAVGSVFFLVIPVGLKALGFCLE